MLRCLANVYKTFANEYGRTEVIRKLNVRLVSNQPAEEELREALALARGELTNLGTAEVRTANLLKRLPTQQTIILKRLYDASGLRSVEFSDFLRVFDLSGCGEEGRMIQQLRLVQESTPLNSSPQRGRPGATFVGRLLTIATYAPHP